MRKGAQWRIALCCRGDRRGARHSVKLTPTVPPAMCLCSVDGFLQMGVPPLRIDISHRADGITFEEAIAEVAGFDLEGQAISGIGRSALLKNKKAVGREQDLADVRALQ